MNTDSDQGRIHSNYACPCLSWCTFDCLCFVLVLLKVSIMLYLFVIWELFIYLFFYERIQLASLCYRCPAVYQDLFNDTCQTVHWKESSAHANQGFCTWIPWKLSFGYISFHEKRLQTMLWDHNARVNSHQRWKQTRFRVCFHLWCELTSTMNVKE